jgi:hypothetical protein
MHDMSNTRKEIAARLGFAAGNGAKAKFGRFDTEFKFLDFQIMQQPDLAQKNVIALAEKMGAMSNITKDEMDGLMRAAKWLKMESQVKSAYESARSRMSRPGAKASFGRAEDVYRLLETTPSSYNNAKKLDALATEAMRLANITPAGKNVSLHELAEMVGQDLEGDRSRASRPGAKDEFGGMKGLGDWTVGFTDVMKERIAQLKQLAKSLKATVTLGRLSPNGMYSGTVNRRYGPMEPPDLMAPKKVEQLIKSLGGYENDSWRYNARPGAKTRMTREQTEEQKAGLKIMSAVSPAVGAKIAKLIKEGKPQDQAVAIALDMKRRGEL